MLRQGFSTILAATAAAGGSHPSPPHLLTSLRLFGARWASAIPQPAYPEPFQVSTHPHSPSFTPPFFKTKTNSQWPKSHKYFSNIFFTSFHAQITQDPDTFYARDIEYQLIPPTKQQPTLPSTKKDVKFGTVFTDHMLVAEHIEGEGWTPPLIRPFGYLQLHPAAQVLHYGMTCFEGMKVYKGINDGRPRLFRPDMNMARLSRSSRRLHLAPWDPQELLECIKALIKVDEKWLPTQKGHSLYIRPFLFSSAHVLGVAKATRTTMSVVLSPVGPYFPSGMQPISLFVEERATRAWPGGVGEFKVGGNYAPTIQPQVAAAASHGAHQVVYTFNNSVLSDPDDAVFEECGAMNIFFLLEKKGAKGQFELITPGLEQGTILPGVTRDSILALARQWGEFEVSERPLTVREVRSAAADGRLREIFGSGTACIVQPVASLVRSTGEVWTPVVTDPEAPGALAPRLQEALMEIQYGHVDHPWSVPIE